MKKIGLCAAVLGIAFISCKKAEPVTPAEPGNCTIKGTIDAPLDLSNDTTEAGTFIENFKPEALTSGKLTFVVDSKDLDLTPDDSFDYQKLIFTATIANGEYSISVPAIAEALTVEVYGDDFNAAQRQYVPGDPDSFEEENKKFTFGPISIDGVVNGLTIVENITYDYE